METLGLPTGEWKEKNNLGTSESEHDRAVGGVVADHSMDYETKKARGKAAYPEARRALVE